MKKVFLTTILVGLFSLSAVSKAISAEKFSLNLDYSGMFAAIASGKVKDNVSPLLHGGSLSFNWRFKESRWGLQVPFGYHQAGRTGAIDFGINGAFHFLKNRESKVDPYLLVGGRMFGALVDNSIFLPLINFGGGVRVAVSEKIGLHADIIASPLIFFVPVFIVEAKAGVSIKF